MDKDAIVQAAQSWYKAKIAAMANEDSACALKLMAAVGDAEDRLLEVLSNVKGD